MPEMGELLVGLIAVVFAVAITAIAFQNAASEYQKPITITVAWSGFGNFPVGSSWGVIDSTGKWWPMPYTQNYRDMIPGKTYRCENYYQEPYKDPKCTEMN
jgi:hypothetical protein